MSGIEKVDELTGEYPGSDMYRYKHNGIQVCPHNRKQFRNQQAILYIEKPVDPEYRIYWDRKCGAYQSCKKSELLDYLVIYDGKFYDAYTLTPRWVKKEFTYALYATSLQGSVCGLYVNWTTDMSAVKRKMKRMLRCKKLVVVEFTGIEVLQNTLGV